MTVRELLKLLYRDGWFVDHTTGSHIQMAHPTKKGMVTVPNHKGDIAPGTLSKIKWQAGWK
jgi:predicted RNA binding protein YcfA (HicA-like mRNA interferase family)